MQTSAGPSLSFARSEHDLPAAAGGEAVDPAQRAPKLPAARVKGNQNPWGRDSWPPGPGGRLTFFVAWHAMIILWHAPPVKETDCMLSL